MNAAFLRIENRFINIDRLNYVEVVSKNSTEESVRLSFHGGDKLELDWEEAGALIQFLMKSSKKHFKVND